MSSQSYALVLVTFNRSELLRKVLSSIATYPWHYDRFLIVDNASTDATGDVLHQFKHKLGLDIITSTANVGHGAGLALAFEFHAKLKDRSRFLVLLEDDSMPEADTVPRLMSLITASGFGVLSSNGWQVSPGLRRKVLSDSLKEVDFCLFDGAIIDSQVLEKVGFPVSDWFMMMDDFEFCFRIKQAGFKLGVCSAVSHTVGHLGGGGRFTSSTLWRGYYQARNHVFFLKRWPTIFNVFDFLILEGKRQLGCLLARDRFRRLGLRLIGIVHGLAGKKGRTLDPVTLRFSSPSEEIGEHK